MKLVDTEISGLWIAETSAFRDERGAFTRLFCSRELHDAFGQRSIVQINHSITHSTGAVRGMHFQHAPHAEMKVVRCMQGGVFDVAVDLRQGSPSLLKWVAVELTPENGLAFIIPEGCAHGFQVLKKDSQLLYLHTAFYTPGAEDAVRFDDPAISVDWPLVPTDISKRDLSQPYLEEDFKGIAI